MKCDIGTDVFFLAACKSCDLWLGRFRDDFNRCSYSTF